MILNIFRQFFVGMKNDPQNLFQTTKKPRTPLEIRECEVFQALRPVFRSGGDNWNRTSDPLHVKQVL